MKISTVFCLVLFLQISGCKGKVSSDDSDSSDEEIAQTTPTDEKEETAPVPVPDPEPEGPVAPSGLSYGKSTYDWNLAEEVVAQKINGSCGDCTFTVSPSLPTGLKLSSTSGAISGKPTALSAPKTYKITAENSGGAFEMSLNLAVGIDRVDTSSFAIEADTMPIVTGDGSVIQIGDTIYKFGGASAGANACAGTSDQHIYTASVAAPTAWTDEGVKLPVKYSFGGNHLRIGDEVYLFGSQCSANIQKAPIDDLIDGWVDTAATIAGATVRSFNQIEVVGDKIYAFGMGAGYDEIWSAEVSAPTVWTNTTKTLPGSVRYLYFFKNDDYLYIVGNGNTIYRADVDAPADWTDIGPNNIDLLVDSGAFAAVGDTTYILGGHNRDTIYSAKTNDLESWTDTGHSMPTNGHWGQNSHAIIGSKLYMFGGQRGTPTGDNYKGSTTILSGDIVRAYN